MVRTIKEALARYKRAVIKYRSLKNKVKRREGTPDWETYLESDGAALAKEGTRLKAMANVLGLTRNEVATISKEIRARLTRQP